MARRLLYFPLTVNEIKRHFGSISRSPKEPEASNITANITANTNSFSLSNSSSYQASSHESLPSSVAQSTQQHLTWFTCKINEKDLVLPLHLPIGLLYDLVSAFKGESENCYLPWKLEFHISTTSPPTYTTNLLSQVVNYTPFPDESQLSSFYFSTLKEADHLRSGSARNVMNLSRAEQLQLWESVKGAEFERFWRINQKLLAGTSRSIPIKFWICELGTFKMTRLQFPVTIQQQSCTLKDLLISEFSELFVTKLKQICVHGVQVPLSITLEELNYNWNYSDNFIHILLIIN